MAARRSGRQPTEEIGATCVEGGEVDAASLVLLVQDGELGEDLGLRLRRGRRTALALLSTVLPAGALLIGAVALDVLPVALADVFGTHRRRQSVCVGHHAVSRSGRCSRRVMTSPARL